MGPYDNDAGVFLEADGYESGHWYLNEDGVLYIVPNGEAEIEGPDDVVLEALNTVYREQPFGDIDPNVVAEKLSLDVVLDIFKRFSPDVGYFNA